MIRDQLLIAGAGGQGALRIGQMIAHAAMNEGFEVEWLPSYGAEMRGGTANCAVNISDTEILCCMVTNPDCLIVMNDLSLARFGASVRSGGTIILNSTLIKERVAEDNLNVYYIPADLIAEEEDNLRGANMVMLGVYIAVSGRIPAAAVYEIIDQSFTGTKAKYAVSNKRLVERGITYIEGQLQKEKREGV
ncbi:2-oxoglutarate ferredoxin oxidoreductase subunit gamma [Spirochaetia bacterium]|nr:2-oxoglutarate ferredoxin oxidoreductase subunit gamma [Spirochaetia bacterium]